MWYKFSKIITSKFEHYKKFTNFDEALEEIYRLIQKNAIFFRIDEDEDEDEDYNLMQIANAIIRFNDMYGQPVSSVDIEIEQTLYSIPIFLQYTVDPQYAAFFLTKTPYIVINQRATQSLDKNKIKSILIHELSHAYEFLRKYHRTQEDRFRKEKSYFTTKYLNEIQKSKRTPEEKQNLINTISYLAKPTEVRARLNQILAHPNLRDIFNEYMKTEVKPSMALQKTIHDIIGNDYRLMPSPARAKLHNEVYKYLYQTGRGYQNETV